MKDKSTKDWVFVCLQVMFFVLYLQDFSFVEWSISANVKILFQLVSGMGLLWSLLAMLSMNTLVSPFPSPKKEMQLQTKGVYGISRHPIYSGILLFFYAWGLAYASEFKLIIAICFNVFIYFKASYEEKLLQHKFPAYDVYKKNTGMFFPRLRSYN